MLDGQKAALDNDTSQNTRKSMGMDGGQAWYVRNKKRRFLPQSGRRRRFTR